MPSCGAGFPLLCLEHPPSYPSSVPTHSSFSTRELQAEETQHQAPLTPSPGQTQVPARPCPMGKGTGAGQSPMGWDRDISQALACSVLPEQLL